MLKRMLRFSVLLLLFAMSLRGGWAQSLPETSVPGPDIILGNLPSLIQAGSNGTQVGLAIATDICNNGDVQVNWFRLPETDHPVIPQNLYRLSGGANNDERFEQIGQSWVMHQYFPLQQNGCGFGCTPSPDFAHLGVGCSTADSASINGSQVDLGSRAWVHPFTGAFLSTSNSHTGHTHDGTTHRILVEGSDLNTTMNQGATYYAEAQLITPHEYAWCQAHLGECNMFNNVSYRQFMVVGTTNFNFSAVGPTVPMAPAIQAWPGATIQTIEPEPGVDGRAFIAYKVTGPFGGIWHYEYAIYNQNLDRAIQSFSVAGGCGFGPPSNLGFHAPLNHPGMANDGTVGDAGYSNTPWTAQTSDAGASWHTETFALNPNANALRWGTLYNFRFQHGTPPTVANATIGFFKTGAPIIVPVLGPASECLPTPTPTATPSATATPTPPPCGELLGENFDGVIAPALPPGWSSTDWVTSTTTSDTLPNNAFVDDPPVLSDKSLISPTLRINSASAQVAFRNNYNLEGSEIAFHDGGVLEVSINGGPFDDVTHPSVGGSFASGGYNGIISDNFGSAIASRPAWSGNSGGYINTVVNFGPHLNGQFIQLKFRMASDTSGAGVGWRIDTISFTGICGFVTATPTPTPPTTATPTPTPNPTLTPTPSATPSPVPTPILPPGGNGKIAFQSTRNGNDSDICVMDPDGSNLTNLTANLFLFMPDHDPDWSPDGTKIVFGINTDEFSQDNIYVMDANGANAVQLTNISKDFAPVWSPDGQKIAFGSYRDGNSEIYVMNADGSNPINLTNNPAEDGPSRASCTWSPDGGKIAFASNRGGGGNEIYVMAADGSNQVQLINTPGDKTEPDWSPDGTKIAFANTLAGNRDIYVVNADGSNPIRLTNSPPGTNSEPNWSPDGTKIVFTSTRDPATPPGSNYETYVMDADGSNQTNLTNNPAPDFRPDWQRIAPPPGPTPTPSPATQALNLSTRMFVQTGDNVGIGGFIITGTGPKHVILRAIGPSLTDAVQKPLADPVLELHGPGGFATIINDNWRDTQEQEIIATGIPPTDNLESAIVASLAPGNYTGVVRGNGHPVGVALIELYDLDPAADSKLANISTRAFVQTGPHLVIAGFILGNGAGADTVIVRGLGPSLSGAGVSDVLANPTLELRNGNGTLLIANDDWQDDPVQAAFITAAGLAPSDEFESAIAATLPPGPYTALLAGALFGFGNGLVEVYDLGTP